MKGDFSRIRFNPARQYTSVLKQQGRVDFDSDSNEQRFIDESLRESINTDVIGPFGGPENDAGFLIEIKGNEILIGPGRYYVDGILVENPSTVRYDKQPWLIEPSSSAADLLQQLLDGGQQGSISFVLQVWQRLVTALDDPCLLEPALNQADTTARLQTVWRVIGSYDSGVKDRAATESSTVASTPSGKVVELGSATQQASPISHLSPCCQALYDRRILLPFPGEMSAGLNQGGSDCGCQPVAAAGYQGLENQLYRVEIHKGGDLSTATFKWSRENASVVTKVKAIGFKNPIVTVTSLGPDANLGFQPGQWVELSDDSYLFGDTPRPGQLFKIVSINPAALQVTLDNPVHGINTGLNARMRRWDQVDSSATNSGIPLSAAPIPLENGIEVEFSRGNFQTGDYWTIPARTVNGEIDWPPCGSTGRIGFRRPNTVQVHQAPVACVQLRSHIDQIFIKGVTGTAQARTLVNDCRLLFPPLTAVNPDTVPPALHISAASWTNDDIMTVDALLANGLSVTFDQPTTCPWGGGNFQVAIELPAPNTPDIAIYEGKIPGVTIPTFPSPAGTDYFMRTVMALDPPWGITVSGNQVIWIAPYPGTIQADPGAVAIFFMLNTLLTWQAPNGFARVRVRLLGGAVYGAGPNGNIYLDGQAFGYTGSRLVDSSEDVNLSLPSGNNLNVSDFQGWFYLAPTVYIASVVIQGVNNGTVAASPLTAVKILVNNFNQVTGLQIGETATITGMQALITLTYTPISPVTVNLVFTGTGAGTVISIASSVQIPAGQLTFTVPINVLSNPGVLPAPEVVTLNASVEILGTAAPVSSPPQLSITGSTPPQGQTHFPVPFPQPVGKL